MPQILPLLNENGLVLTQVPTFIMSQDGPSPALKTTILHVESGESLDSTAPLMLDKQTAQGLGSAITYMRRYSILAILGLVADVDDDGNAAEKSAPKRTQTTRRQPARTTTADAGDDW